MGVRISRAANNYFTSSGECLSQCLIVSVGLWIFKSGGHSFHVKFLTQIFTGKYFSKALILATTNPQYDKRLFIKLQVQCMKTASSEHGVYLHKLFWMPKQNKKTIYVHNLFSRCSELGISIYWTRNSMNNLSSYCGLVVARISASEKDLPVPHRTILFRKKTIYFPYFHVIQLNQTHFCSLPLAGGIKKFWCIFHHCLVKIVL